MRKKIDLSEMLIAICVSYTIISLVNAGLAIGHGSESISAANEFNIILWTSLGVGVLYTHHYFERLSPLVMIIVQYGIALGLVFAVLFIEAQFVELHPDAYRDGFRSFTIPYIIGGSLYYIEVFRDAKMQNKLLQEIKSNKA
ncbi:DUF6608 family protein [Vallitalea okinawensis]|uniref:DUF6608 family protein n=1 Tax=Vallitalea okinawensis TaxID=2078660 RepID=UPI000CFA9B99|nr:DUF6608 family protein [Vallitalea okinawensis]